MPPNAVARAVRDLGRGLGGFFEGMVFLWQLGAVVWALALLGGLSLWLMGAAVMDPSFNNPAFVVLLVLTIIFAPGMILSAMLRRRRTRPH